MFDDVRRAFRELLHGNATPEERRSALAEMKETLVLARMGLDDLRKAVEVTRTRVAAERRELETVRRRRTLAEGIKDQETVDVATRFERQLQDKIAVFEKKLEAQEAELAYTEREISEMTAEMKAAAAGARFGPVGAPVDPPLGAEPTDPDVDVGGERLSGELDRLARERRRAEADAAADERLAALKRRMGQ
jgi:hypothetical protein